MTKEEPLTIATEAIEFASDALTTQLNPWIQQVYSKIYHGLHGRLPKRPIWVADGQRIGVVLDWSPHGGYAAEGLKVLTTVSEELGITLTPTTPWEDAALALRDKTLPGNPRS